MENEKGGISPAEQKLTSKVQFSPAIPEESFVDLAEKASLFEDLAGQATVTTPASDVGISGPVLPLVPAMAAGTRVWTMHSLCADRGQAGAWFCERCGEVRVEVEDAKKVLPRRVFTLGTEFCFQWPASRFVVPCAPAAMDRVFVLKAPVKEGAL